MESKSCVMEVDPTIVDGSSRFPRCYDPCRNWTEDGYTYNCNFDAEADDREIHRHSGRQRRQTVETYAETPAGLFAWNRFREELEKIRDEERGQDGLEGGQMH